LSITYNAGHLKIDLVLHTIQDI